MWVFGLGIASEISKVIQKKIGVGAWDKPKGVDYINPFSPAFYLDKVAQKTEMNDTAWLDANLLSETKQENIIGKPSPPKKPAMAGLTSSILSVASK